MKNLVEKFSNNIAQFLQHRKLSDLDKRIVEAEKDLLASCIRWQSLLAIREARKRTHADTVSMFLEAYKQHDFNSPHLSNLTSDEVSAVKI